MSKISTIIKQSKFTGLDHEALIGTLILYHQIIQKQKELFKKFNITSQQYNVLRILKGQYPNPINILDIKTRMIDKMSDVSRLADRLVLSNLVEKKNSNSDKRSLDIIITEKGLNLLESISPYINTHYPFDKLNDEELNQYLKLLEKLIEQ